MYALLGILFLFLIVRELARGPDPNAATAADRARCVASRPWHSLWFLIVGVMIDHLRRCWTASISVRA